MTTRFGSRPPITLSGTRVAINRGLFGGFATPRVRQVFWRRASCCCSPRPAPAARITMRRPAPRIRRQQRPPPTSAPTRSFSRRPCRKSAIQSKVDSIAAQQRSNQFGSARYALLFEPGTYGSSANPLIFQVGYYTQVAGLGASPKDVTINGSVDVYNQCAGTQCTALNNFWRSLSNLTINVTGGSGCKSNTEFWAASQAAPLRRVAINGKLSLMDYCNGGPGYASGGFLADSVVAGAAVVNGSQQQYFVRNTQLDGWSNGVWNQVFVGTPGAPAQSFARSRPVARALSRTRQSRPRRSRKSRRFFTATAAANSPSSSPRYGKIRPARVGRAASQRESPRRCPPSSSPAPRHPSRRSMLR